MEFMEQPGPSGACNLLGVPGLSTLDVDDDEGEVVIGIRPKSSPLPRRRNSVSDEDSEPEPPLCGSRRVSFADAKGLSLVHVKKFDSWDVPKLPGYDSSEGKGKDAEEYFLSPLTFYLPLSTEELFDKVREQKVELESIELLPGTTILKGVIRVLNISFSKAVYVRITLDSWSSHFDLLAEYIPGSSDSLMDCFSFKLTLVPPFGEQGARVDFCLRYETSVGTFWTNNNNRNYVLFCHQRVKERKEKPQKENVNMKSCLKTISQKFSTVENISGLEASFQQNNKNISTDVSKNGQEVDTTKATQISDCQSGTSEEAEQKLLTESRQNYSQRSRRKAIRMTQLRDHFAERGGGGNDTERDESPPAVKQTAQEETQEEKHTDLQSFSELSSKSEDSEFVSKSLETCSESVPAVLHYTSPTHDYTSNSEPEKSESINLADSATLTGGESATDTPDNPLHSNDEIGPADCQHINKCVSKVEERNQRQGVCYECTRNIAVEPYDSVISAVSSEILVSQTSSFTFGTVVAPLYHQVFGRVGSESQSAGDWGNPVQATLNVVDLTQRYAHTERRETRCTVPTKVIGKADKVQGNVIKTQKSNQECLDATLSSPPIVEEETSLSVTANDILDPADTLQDAVEIIYSGQRHTNTPEVPKTISGDTEAQPHTVNTVNTDLLNLQITTESLHLQGKAQDSSLTRDLQSQTTAETAQAQLPEHACKNIKNNLVEPVAQKEMEEVLTCQETSFVSLQLSQSVSEHVSDKTVQHASGSGANECVVTKSTINGITEEDKPLETLHDWDPNQNNNSVTKETENSYISVFETGERKDVTTLQMSLETQEETNNVEGGNTVVDKTHSHETKHSGDIKITGEVAESMMSNNHIHGELLIELKDEDILKDKTIIVSEKIDHHEMEAVVSKQEDSCLAGTTEVNWEMMVEEEEKNLLTDEEESKALLLNTEDTKALKKCQGEQLEEAWIETGLEKTEIGQKKTEDEIVGEITVAREKENKADDADVLVDKQRIGEEGIVEIVAGNYREELKKKLQYIQATKTKKTLGEEEQVEEFEVEKRDEQEKTELEKEKHFEEIREVNIERTNVQEEEEIEGKEEMAKDLNDDEEAGVEWEDQVNPREENNEEQNPDYKEEILVYEKGESEIVDNESQSRTTENGGNEVEYFEERLDILQNKVEGGLSALVNNVQDKRVIDIENTGEGQNAHLPSEMHLYKDEDFQSNENVTHDRSKAAIDENDSAAAEAGPSIFADEPESDQKGHDSASAESDSDDEVELYMHCLRAVHTGAQAHKDRNKDTGFSVGRRPSVSRSKPLSSPMPPISESLDEEQHLSCLQDNHEDTETEDIHPTAAALRASSGQESLNRSVSWWIEYFSCSNISKTLLYATLLVIFLVVAYYYDFLACFGLYLISMIWLCCQGERQPVKNNNRIG
ncbi:uncharacterized protein ppp1r3ab [Micropterus dolomieu]|uniref:uncharacterized protein ppp1r3ab n=1 Tax=Micropterus dolomieu TaxID=147949 RepID=UPI001E8ED489|nr:uncharacterized protein ppp1r3ab [Micropterus dolomieu]